MQDFDEQDILMFMEITGGTADAAKNYLTVSEGNTESAIALYMESGGADISRTIPTASEPRAESQPMSWQAQPQEDIRAPIAARHETLIEEDELFGVRGHGFTPGNRFESFQEPFTAEEEESHQESNRLSQLFKPPVDISFKGDLDRARTEARNGKKWLLVTVSDVSEFGCLALNRDLWRDDDVREMISSHFIFIYLEADSAEGKRHIMFYPIDNYPYIAIMDPMTGERLRYWNIPLSPIEFVSEMLEFLDNPHPSSSKPLAKPVRKSVTEMSEEEQMRLAMEASLTGSSGALAAQPIVIDDDEDIVEVVETPEMVCKSIQPIERPEPKSGDITRIQFRLPDGSRLVRAFDKGDKVQAVFEFIKSKVPETVSAPFELMSFREPLLQKINLSIQEAKLAGASLTLDYL